MNTPQSEAMTDGSTSKNLCVILPETDGDFTHAVFQGLKDFCDKNQLNPVTYHSEHNAIKEQRHLRSLLQSWPDYVGLVFMPVDYKFYNDEMMNLSLIKYPVVVVDRYMKGIYFSSVTTDDDMAMEEAIKFLYVKKHRHIVYMTPSLYKDKEFYEREMSYINALLKYYESVSLRSILPIRCSASNTSRQKVAVTKYLMKYGDTDAMIVTGDQAGIVINAAEGLGIRIPEDLRLMVIDCKMTDKEKAATRPFIMDRDPYAMGYEAGMSLYDQVYGDKNHTNKKLPVRIIDHYLGK